MSKDELPEIPSWEELGISAEELKELEAEPEEAESGGAPDKSVKPGAPTDAAAVTKPGTAGPTQPSPRAQRKARKAQEKAKKAQAKAEAHAARDARKQVARKPAAAGSAATAGAEAGDAGSGPPPPRPAAPSGGMRGPLTTLLLLGMAWAFSSARVAPSPLGTNAPDSVFAADRAMVHMENMARAPHPPGSPEHTRVREYLLSELRQMGLQPTVQTTTEVVGSGPFRRAATVRNILARIPGASTTGTILLTAHYDGREIARAAGDDASGVSAILESLRALSTGDPLRNDVMVLITDGEELGLMGARAFVNQHPWMSEVTLVISIEMRGGAGPSIMFETGSDNGWIIEQLKAGNPDAFGNSLTYEVYKRLPNDTDFTPFKEAGKQGLNYAGIANAHVYHQAYDSPENFSSRTLQHHGVNTLSMLRHLGDTELTTISAPDRIYFTLPYLGLITYSRLWAYGLSGLLVLLLIGCLGFVRSSGARISGIAVGAGGGLVSVVAVAGLGLGLVRFVTRFHPEAGQLHGSLFHSEGWYVAGLAAASVAVTTFVFGLLRRWFSLSELSAGAVLLPALGGIVLGVWQPFAAMNLQWPALCGLAAAAVVTGVTRAQRPGLVRWVLLVALAMPVLALMVPLTELLWLAMNISLAPALGALMVLALLSALPLIEIMREPNGWWATAVSLLAAAALIGIGVLKAAPNPERPAPSTLLYAVDRGSNESLWLTDGPESPASGEQARAWAVDRVGEANEERSFAAFMGRDRTYATTDAPERDLAVPLVSILSDSTSSGLRLAVRSQVGAEMLMFGFGETGPKPTAVNGVALDGTEPIRVVEHWGEPEGSVFLDFDVPADDSLSFDLVEHHFRPIQIVGPEPFRRPADLAPNIRRWSDRAMIRTPVVVSGGAVTLGGGETGPDGAPAQGPAVGDSASVGDTVTAGDSVAAGASVAAPDSMAVPDSVAVSADSMAAADSAASGTTNPGQTPG